MTEKEIDNLENGDIVLYDDKEMVFNKIESDNEDFVFNNYKDQRILYQFSKGKLLSPRIQPRENLYKKPLEHQEGGNHYKDFAIQPAEYIQKNNLNWCQGNAVKYVTRYKSKNGLEDLKKAKHYIDMLIDFEYWG